MSGLLHNPGNYYPFGMVMPGRNFNDLEYRYGFNGAEKDDEAKGLGNQIDFKFRAYDTRLGRFFAVDPFNKRVSILYTLPICWQYPYTSYRSKRFRTILYKQFLELTYFTRRKQLGVTILIMEITSMLQN